MTVEQVNRALRIFKVGSLYLADTSPQYNFAMLAWSRDDTRDVSESWAYGRPIADAADGFIITQYVMQGEVLLYLGSSVDVLGWPGTKDKSNNTMLVFLRGEQMVVARPEPCLECMSLYSAPKPGWRYDEKA